MINTVKIVFLAVGLTLISAARTFGGPPFMTDDPEPVEYKHSEFYIFSTMDKTK